MRSLVIGYGNPSRRDDGVALHVVNALRAHWGQPALPPSLEGWEELGSIHDSLFLQQLTPELAATVAQYDLLVLVDAALLEGAGPVRVERVVPSYAVGAISHHLAPGTLLALTQQLYGRAPVGWLVSIQGHDFDFGDELSPQTASALPGAVERVLELITSVTRPGPCELRT